MKSRLRRHDVTAPPGELIMNARLRGHEAEAEADGVMPGQGRKKRLRETRMWASQEFVIHKGNFASFPLFSPALRWPISWRRMPTLSIATQPRRPPQAQPSPEAGIKRSDDG